MSTSTTRTAKTKHEPLRFAHPFYTKTPPEARQPTPFGKRMTDHIQGTLYPIPKPRREPTMTLADIVGTGSAQDIEHTGTLIFHAVGDTGRGKDSPQGDVAEAMASDFNVTQPESSPAFLFHLGDVIYGHHKDQSYRPEFYEPYEHYPGKIIAIPGNHDREQFPNTDPTTARAFLTNFCAAKATVLPIAGSIFRQAMTQPGIFWILDAPFVDIIGLDSNGAENPGFISGPIPGSSQKKWLVSTLKAIAKRRNKGTRKGLIIATHHPPFSAAGHSGSTQMLADIDDACTQAQVMPDVFLSAHAHNYQRYTRSLQFSGRAWEIPFVVAGMGGKNDQSVPAATGQREDDHAFVASRKGFGYLVIEASASTIRVKSIGVETPSGVKSTIDTATVSLATNTIT
jgi:calcineurin-like phosphoesterase family protein